MPRFNANSGEYTTEEAKPMPVILLLDTSSSMNGSKIDALNDACSRMVKKLKKEAAKEVKVVLTVITFGNGGAKLITDTPHQDITKFEWKTLTADGVTPMDKALKMVKALIEDKEITPSRIFRPLVILVSDGEPTDDNGRLSDNWMQPLDNFINGTHFDDGKKTEVPDRSSKCDRLAMGIMCHTDVLERFVNGTGNCVITANDVDDIIKFFKYVTMSILQRSQLKDSNRQASRITSIANDTVKPEKNTTSSDNQSSEPMQDDESFEF